MGTTEKVFANDLIEREVLDLSAGVILGSIVDYVISGNGTVALIGILGERWFAGGSGIPPAAITNINEHRVTIKDATEVSAFDPDGDNLFSVNTDTYIWGKNVLTDAGELLGGLEDFSFSLGDGTIIELVVSDNSDKRHKIPVDKILTIGKDYIIITPGSDMAHASTPVSVSTIPASTPAPSAPAPAPAAVAAHDDEDAGEGSAVRDSLPAFDRKKYDFLAGKRAHRDISDESGNLIASTGTTLNDEIMAKIVDSGLLSRIFIEMTSEQ